MDRSNLTFPKEQIFFYRHPLTHRIDNGDTCATDCALQVNCTGYSWFSTTFRVDTFRQDYYCFYLVHGAVRISSPVETVLRPGELIIYAPGTQFIYQNDDDFAYYWVHFTGHSAGELLAQAGLLPDRVHRPGIHQRMITQFRMILEAMRSRQPLWELEAAAALTGFILDAGRQLAPVRGNADTIRETENYIQSHIRSQISVRELAEIACMSVNGFSASFKAQYGLSPTQYMAAIRIRRAIELLDETSLSVEAIARDCGFSDPLYFSRFFRKNCGVGPREWRQERRKARGG